MYETSFQVAALRKSAIRSLADLDGKKSASVRPKARPKGFSGPPPRLRMSAR